MNIIQSNFFLTMKVVYGKTLPRSDMKTSANSVDFHVTVNLTSFCESVFLLFQQRVVLALLELTQIVNRPSPLLVSFLHFCASVAASAQVQSQRFMTMEECKLYI